MPEASELSIVAAPSPHWLVWLWERAFLLNGTSLCIQEINCSDMGSETTTGHAGKKRKMNKSFARTLIQCAFLFVAARNVGHDQVNRVDG